MNRRKQVKAEGLISMRLLFSGSTTCSIENLKRLLVIADEIAFMDRPSISFGGTSSGWGTIGSESEVRNHINGFIGKPVTLSVHSPPSGPANVMYQRYILADLANLEFRRIFLDGISKAQPFANKFIHGEVNYGECIGTKLIEALVSDPELLSVPIGDVQLEGEPFRIADPQGRKDTLRLLLTEASVQLTSTMIISGQTGHMPVTDDPYFGQLLAMRSSDRSYVGGTHI